LPLDSPQTIMVSWDEKMAEGPNPEISA
jgi:hypothetical protein